MKVLKDGNRFYIEESSFFVGEVTYFYSEDGDIAIDHTFVDPSYRGRNIGIILVDAVADYAKNASKKIIPICPYVEKLFQRDGKYEDVWQKNHNFNSACKL